MDRRSKCESVRHGAREHSHTLSVFLQWTHNLGPRVEERFHRVNHDRMELTVTIDDPKMCTRPWIAMDKFPLRLQDPHFDVTEMYCSPSEMEKYNKLFGSPASEEADNPHGQ